MADPDDARVTEAVRTALDFAGLDDQQLRRVIAASSLRIVPAGTILLEKGSPPDGLYVVVSGALRIFDVIRGSERDIAAIGPGDFTGEVSLALHTARTRSAQAKEDSEVLVIPVAAFEELSTAHPSMGAHLIEAFEERSARREEAAETD